MGLLQRLAAGEPRAVDALVDRYSGLMWSIAREYLRDPIEAEDAVQEITIALWKHAARFDPAKGRETSFVATIARRRCIDRLRQLGRRPPPEPIVADVADETNVVDQVSLGDEAARADALLEELRPQQERVLRLALYRGWTHSEISAHLEMPLGTVKTHARRGLIRLRELLGEDGGEDG